MAVETKAGNFFGLMSATKPFELLDEMATFYLILYLEQVHHIIQHCASKIDASKYRHKRILILLMMGSEWTQLGATRRHSLIFISRRRLFAQFCCSGEYILYLVPGTWYQGTRYLVPGYQRIQRGDDLL